MANPEQGQPRRDKPNWTRWGSWLAGGFAIAANILGVIEVATAAVNWPVFSLIAGACAIAGAVVWLSRLSANRYSPSTRRQIIALNVIVILIGAGLIGFVAIEYLNRPPPRAQAEAPLATSSPTASPQPTASPEPTASPSATATVQPPPSPPRTPDGGQKPPPSPTTGPPPGPFTGNILITFPEYGWHLASGGDLSGTITQWRSGYQIWMSARVDGTTTEIVQGPCAVNGGTFVCSDVQLPGNVGVLEYIQVAVVTNATAAQLPGSDKLPASTAADSDWTHIYKD